MLSLQSRLVVLCLATAWVGACGGGCPAISRPALEITIENCIYDGQALYGAIVEHPDGSRQTLACTPGRFSECSCWGGSTPGDYHVTITPNGRADALEELEVSVGTDSCGTVTEKVFYEAVHVSQLPRPACETASEHLTSCGVSTDDARCVQAGLRARVPDSGEDFAATSDCLDGCVSAPSCDELERDFCAPAEEVTDHELCLADCFDLSEEDIAEYAPQVGPTSYCNVGGAGGADG